MVVSGICSYQSTFFQFFSQGWKCRFVVVELLDQIMVMVVKLLVSYPGLLIIHYFCIMEVVILSK